MDKKNVQTGNRTVQARYADFYDLVNEDMELTLKILNVMPPYMVEVFKSAYVYKESKQEYLSKHDIMGRTYESYVKKSKERFNSIYNKIKSGETTFEAMENRYKTERQTAIEKLLRENPDRALGIIKTLPYNESRILSMHLLEGKDYGVISEKLGLSRRNIANYMCTGTKKVIERMERTQCKPSSRQPVGGVSTSYLVMNKPVYTVDNEEEVLEALKECPPRLAREIFSLNTEYEERRIAFDRYINNKSIVDLMAKFNVEEQKVYTSIESGGKIFLRVFYYIRNHYGEEDFESSRYDATKLSIFVRKAQKDSALAAAERRKALIEVISKHRNKE